MPKKISLYLILGISILFSACKKGEDDPVISFRTRKNRLVGEWKLVSGTSSITQDVYNQYATFDGSHYTFNGTVSYGKGNYTLSLKIKKDGSFSVNELLDATILELSGIWNFNTGVGELKSKESVVFSGDIVTKGHTSGGNIFNRYSSTFEYRIKELRHKKLVLRAEGKVYSESEKSYTTLVNDYTFELRD